MVTNKIKKISFELMEWLENEEFRGYDPYDALNCSFLNKIASFHPFVQQIIIHIVKNLPFNIRPYLGIKKSYNPTAFALFLESYLNYYQITKNSFFLNKCNFFINSLIEMSSINTKKEIGWSRNFKFVTVNEIHDKNTPLTFLNAKIGLSLIKYYEITKNRGILNLIHDIIYAILKYGKIHNTKKGIFIGYAAVKKPRFIFNVNALCAELFLKYIYYTKNKYIDQYNIQNISIDLIETLLMHQNTDGSWIYGYTFDFKKLNNIDFHQGFIIDSLLEITKLDPIYKSNVEESYFKGLIFMVKNQIDEKGFFKWRYPKKYPIDIHNQAQGIISLSKYKGKEFDFLLKKIVEYTIKFFWDEKRKFFYYQKKLIYVIKIPFMRWSEAWMLYALSELLLHKGYLCAEF